MPYTFYQNGAGAKYFSVCAIFQGCTIAACVLRLWGRRIQSVSWRLNDYSILIALAITIANLGIVGASVKHGMGMHVASLDLVDIVMFSKLQTVISITWIWSLFFIKVSILDIYIDIFQIPWFIKTCYVYLAFQVAWVIAVSAQILTLCHPIEFQWDKTIPGGSCRDFLTTYYSVHIIIFITDFILAVLPVPVLWGLNMNIRKKLGVTIMFMLGIIIGVFNLIRIAWRSKVSSLDITYDYALLFTFSVLEAQLGILLASIPVMQPILRKAGGLGLFSALHSNYTRKSTKNSSSVQLQTIGSMRTRSYPHKKGSSDTDSICPLGLAETGASTTGGTADAGKPDSGPNEGAIHVEQTWEVKRQW
ncbi:hypothetical protein K458DRAFT_393679 [Lentithecium fluviatile CBS 122367]|uniref:Rhodopsin domain-containing protein n=1 Tax=Lentithecium fluviatile CBS 122367 TaxID=1168545 RepID=A0A6G1INU8_9PLEO|nr:hypothetical protein K458DRAFT_393679 [Lentithecium fluviatile CBS 122367]